MHDDYYEPREPDPSAEEFYELEEQAESLRERLYVAEIDLEAEKRRADKLLDSLINIYRRLELTNVTDGVAAAGAIGWCGMEAYRVIIENADDDVVDRIMEDVKRGISPQMP